MAKHTLEEKELKYRRLNNLVEMSRHIVFLGGAGVSTESGIPDFRGPSGLYKKKDKYSRRYGPEYLLSDRCLSREPEIFFEYLRKNLDPRKLRPNRAHLKLAEMERAGKLDGIITQNIDGLHQKAGSRNVQEIHGTVLRNHCVSCRKEYGPDFVFDSPDKIPKCPVCGKMVRPDVTLYGEYLPEEPYDNAIRMVKEADMLIIGGTTLAVGSASKLAHLYHGQRLVIINKSKTRMEGEARLVFHDSIGKVLDRIEL